MEVKIGIVLTIGGDRKELTLDEARQLRDELNAALQSKRAQYEPYDWFRQPYITPRPWGTPFITWSSDRTDAQSQKAASDLAISLGGAD